MTIYSVIVHYNTSQPVCDLIESMDLIKNVDHNIMIVDNQSQQNEYDTLSSFLKKRNSDKIQLIKTEKNGGFGYGVNRGVDWIYNHRTSDDIYIHVINSDALVIDGTYLQKCVDFLHQNKTVGLVGPKVFMNDGKDVQNTILPITSLNSIINFKRKYSNINHSEISESPTQVDCINGVCFIMSLCVYRQVNGFCEEYFMYNEEQDLCHKIIKAGYSIFFLPYKSILHYGAYNTKEELDWRFLYKRRNQVLFLKKHHSKFQALLLSMIFTATSVPKFLFNRKSENIGWGKFVKQLYKAAL